MRENNRLPRSPVFVVNRGAIFDCNRTHVIFSLSLLGDVEDGPPSTGLNVSLGSRSADCLLAANQPSLRSVLRSPRRGNKNRRFFGKPEVMGDHAVSPDKLPERFVLHLLPFSPLLSAAPSSFIIGVSGCVNSAVFSGQPKYVRGFVICRRVQALESQLRTIPTHS